MTDELLAEQIHYYRERAPEYDATSPQGAPFTDTLARIAAHTAAQVMPWP